jgi:ATP-dependent helicase/nuclease subunit A
VQLEKNMSSPSFQLDDEIVRAGAGAGKTTTLTKKVFKTAFDYFHVYREFPRMVVTTFSRKATQELRERLIVEGIKSDQSEFLDYISSKSKIQISTIHGVLSLFLRRYGHLFNLDSGFRILSEADSSHLAKSVLRQILLEEPQQAEILEIWTINDLTEMLRSYHSAILTRPNLKVPDEKLYFSLLTRYLGSGCGDLLNAIKEAQREVKSKSWMEYLTRLSEIVQMIGRLHSPSDLEGVQGLVSRLGRKPPFSTKSVPEAFSIELRSLIDKGCKELFEKLNKPGLDFNSWTGLNRRSLQFYKIAQSFHESFQLKKEQSGQLEMSDLEIFTLEKLRKNPEVGAAFAQDWDYWLIDEFQDTSPLQVELLEYLIGDRKVFLVGDPQQSIYLFRGARSEVFQQKWEEIGARGGLQSEKLMNFRSISPLLHFFNDVFSKVGPQFKPMIARKTDGDPLRCVATFSVSNCFINEEDSSRSEIGAILHHIQALCDRGVGFQDICILGRTNLQLNQIARCLVKYGYPVHLHAASGFYERREIRDGIGFVRFLLNPRDNINLIEILRSPFFRVSDQQLGLWMAEKPLSLWEKIEQGEISHPSLDRLRAYQKEARIIGVSETLRKMMNRGGLLDFSLLYDGTGRREANVWKLLCQTEEVMRKPGARFLNIGSGQGQEGSTDNGSEESDAITSLEPSRINLMTVHASKGLQFAHVILPRCDSYRQGSGEGHFGVDEISESWGVSYKDEELDENLISLPELLSREERKGREILEHERLLYVALTRAKESVMLSWSDARPSSGSWAEMLSGWVESPGLHHRDEYDYFVDSGPWPLVQNRRKEEKSNEVRAPLTLPESGTIQGVGPKFSVSNYLEEKLELPQLEFVQPGADQVLTRVRASAAGILVHRLMEVLHYSWNFDFTPVLADWFGSDSERVRNSLDYVRSCKVPPFHLLIPKGNVEWGFQVPTRKGILEGQIDLWGRDEQGTYWLVDYKSGSDRFLSKAFHQLSLYSFALRHMGIVGDISLAVVYPLDCKCHIKLAPSVEELKLLFPELFD